MAVGESIVIWGAGKKGKGVVQKIRKGKIKYFIDSDENKIGRYWCGIEIKSVENLYNEDKKTILVYTIENEAVKTIVKKWGGKSYSLKDFFSLPNIIKEIDEDYYTRYLFDKTGLNIGKRQKVDNWYRDSYYNEINQELVSSMRRNDDNKVNEILSSIYDSGKMLFDEGYNVRPGMRLAHRIIGDIGENLHIVDFACGHGELLYQLKKSGHIVYGCDGSPKRIEQLCADGINGTVQNVQKTNYKNNYFDVVICMECLEHVSDIIKTVNEINRVLKQGGYAIVTVPYENECDCTTHVRQIGLSQMLSVFSRQFEVVNMLQTSYLNWTFDDNLFLVAKKQ